MTNAEVTLDSLANKLEKAKIQGPESGVSFAGKSLKMETPQDAQPIVEAINNCSHMEFLNLEGNSLGVGAAEEIAKALRRHPELKRAIWKDMFTGRLKMEIPEALRHLGRGLIEAEAKLEVLDLSDNASGPIGVDGFKELLSSPVCYTLQELRLNNMGLGVTGAKMLATTLDECYEKSVAAGTPLALKVFIAGRNRLENKGAIALSPVFSKVKSLEIVSTPQNGIYEEGIRALTPALVQNKGLRQLNLNDNTVGTNGAKVLSSALANLKELVSLDLGDCLLKTQGALYVAEALKNGSENLEEVNLSFNELKIEAGDAVVTNLVKKPKLKVLSLNGNQFGDDGTEKLKSMMSNHGKSDILGSLSEDEGDEDDEEDEEGGERGDELEDVDSDEDEDEEDEEEEDEDEEESEDSEPYVEPPGVSPMRRDLKPQTPTKVTAAEFLNNPSAENLIALGNDRANEIIQEIKRKPEPVQVEHLIISLMRVSSLTLGFQLSAEVRSSALTCTEHLYRELFTWGHERDLMSNINNTLPVCLGLIKNEDKCNMKKRYNLDACMFAVQNAIKKNIIPAETSKIISICSQGMLTRAS